MKIVILAAGVGSRLHPETADKPKSMIQINGKPLVQYQIDSVLKAGFRHEDIYIVTGHQAGRLEAYLSGTAVNFIHNPHYDTMNNIYSFLLTRVIDDDILLINSDDFYDERLIPVILQAKATTALLVDTQKELTEEAMRVKIEDGRITRVNKQLALSEADGEYIGISKLDKGALAVLYQKAEAMIDAGETNAWYENVYEACAKEINIAGVDTEGYPWIEIDDFNDLEKAKRLAGSFVFS